MNTCSHQLVFSIPSMLVDVNTTKMLKRLDKNVFLSPLNQLMIKNHSTAPYFDQVHQDTPSQHPYVNLYPWKTLNQFVQVLRDGIAYQDDRLIILDKPWGVGIHKKYATFNKKNAHFIDSATKFGDPKYCLMDAIPSLSESLGVKDLIIARALDRWESGLMILAKSEKGLKTWVNYKNRTLATKIPYLKYLAICRGTPDLPDALIEEKVYIRLLEVDELGDHKIPIIDYHSSKSQRDKYDMKLTHASMKIIDANQSLATSLLEIGSNRHKHNFVRAYAASKASFILGDAKFANQVTEIMGIPMYLGPRSPGYDSYEPLHEKVRKRLAVGSNKEIPLHSHLYKVILKRESKEPPVEIHSKKLPHHFSWTLKQLKLSFNNDQIQ